MYRDYKRNLLQRIMVFQVCVSNCELLKLVLCCDKQNLMDALKLSPSEEAMNRTMCQYLLRLNFDKMIYLVVKRQMWLTRTLSCFFCS